MQAELAALNVEFLAQRDKLVGQRDDAMDRLESCMLQVRALREELATKDRALQLVDEGGSVPGGGCAHEGQCDGCELVDGADGAVRSYDLCESCWMQLAPGCRRVTVTEDEVSGDEEDW